VSSLGDDLAVNCTWRAKEREREGAMPTDDILLARLLRLLTLGGLVFAAPFLRQKFPAAEAEAEQA
jgi:hypothetical protein